MTVWVGREDTSSGSVTLKSLHAVLSNGPSTRLTLQHDERAIDVVRTELWRAVSGWFALALRCKLEMQDA